MATEQSTKYSSNCKCSSFMDSNNKENSSWTACTPAVPLPDVKRMPCFAFHSFQHAL